MQIREELVKPILAHFIMLLRSPDIYEQYRSDIKT